MTTPELNHLKIVRKPEVLTLLGLSETSLHRQVKAKIFPPSFSLGCRAVGWYEHEINTVIKAPKNICKKLGLDEKSCWHLCCAAVLDSSRPLKNGQNRVDDFKKLINLNEINYI